MSFELHVNSVDVKTTDMQQSYYTEYFAQSVLDFGFNLN